MADTVDEPRASRRLRAGGPPSRTHHLHAVHSAARPTDMPGMWQRYYTRWKDATREHLDPALLESVAGAGEALPAGDGARQNRYSAFSEPQLLELLQAREADGLIVTGSETDVCVLATVLGAVDLGYRVILVSDAVCSSSDEGHDALMKMYHQRYTEQIEVADAATVIERWEQ